MLAGCRKSSPEPAKAPASFLPATRRTQSIPDPEPDAHVQVALRHVGRGAETDGELVDQPEQVPAEELHVEPQRGVHAVRNALESARLEVGAGAHLDPVLDRLAFDTGAHADGDDATGDVLLLREE